MHYFMWHCAIFWYIIYDALKVFYTSPGFMKPIFSNIVLFTTQVCLLTKFKFTIEPEVVAYCSPPHDTTVKYLSFVY